MLLFNLFIDNTPPKYLNINGLIEKGENDKYYEDYLNSIIDILSVTMRYIRLIEKEVSNEDLEHNLKVINASYKRLKSLKVPKKYKDIQERTLKDIEDFLSDYNNIN